MADDALYNSLVVGSSAVLPLNFCDKNPPLRHAANRCCNPTDATTSNETGKNSEFPLTLSLI
jgi:hypothetical protein